MMTKEEIKANRKTRYESHKEEEKTRSKVYYDTHREERKAYSKFHKKERNACSKTYYESHREEIKVRNDSYKEERKLANIKKNYNLSPEEYNKLLLDSNYKCNSCGSTERLGIDHNHNTGQIRGILCLKCNTALGLLGESIETITKLGVYLANCIKQQSESQWG